MVQFDGYHGTSQVKANSIVKQGIEISKGDEHWFGDGAYFFVEGLSKPDQNAEKYSIRASYNRGLGRDTYVRYGILKVKIEVEERCFLDLNSEDGIAVYNYLIEKYLEKIKPKKKFNSGDFIDGKVINTAREEKIIELDAIKGNMYIKFTLDSRVLNVLSRISNCTMCCVVDPKKNIKEYVFFKGGKISAL